MGLLRRRRANGASEPAIFAAARASRTAPRYFFVFLRKHMTDSEKIAAPAEQPAASEKPMSAAADAVETPSDSAPEKKPRRPRRKKPAVEQATLELSAPENAVSAQPAEEQAAPEAPARKRSAPKQSAAKTARKQSEQPKQPVEAPVEPKQPEQPVLTEHPVQIPAVAASVLPAEAVASAVPAVSEPAAVPAVAPPKAMPPHPRSAAVPAAAAGAAAVPPKAMPPLTRPRRKRMKRPFLMSP